ncbi:MAG: Rieske (2Fe-2S) protein [Acidobacteriota bacterium]
MGELTKVAETKDLKEGAAICIDVNGESVALFNLDGTYYALSDSCTHVGGPLSEGEVSDGRVTCPWHGAQFDLRTGEVLRAPAMEGVATYEVVVEGNDIHIRVP